MREYSALITLCINYALLKGSGPFFQRSIANRVVDYVTQICEVYVDDSMEIQTPPIWQIRVR